MKFSIKAYLPFLLFLSFLAVNAQDLKTQEIKRLRSFQIETAKLNLQDSVTYTNLKSILRLNRKNQGNKIVSISLASLSIATTVYSLRIFENSKNDEEGLGQSIASMLLIPAAIEMGIAIPLFLKSDRQKRKRNRLIAKYQ